MVDIPQPLVEAVSKGRATLFLGAGASKEAGFPSSEQIAAFLTEQAGAQNSKLLSGQKLDSVADYLYIEPGYGPQWVNEKIIRYFEQFHKTVKRPPSPAHQIMTKVRWRTLFTTNYDRLIEISYDSNPDCVQRLLPVYRPDPQTLRHEEDVVRLIKLNGSVDEAARSSSHKLVVTFADQQNAHSYNGLFYSLLKEEAVNGPIVFVGFSFTHPGAYEKASSPEFFALLELLKEIGPAARWHYCVTPLDESSADSKLLKRKLQANQIEVINADFGQFMESLFNHLTSPPSSLEKRPPIIVPVGSVGISIPAEDYSKDKRHFDVIGHHLATEPSPSVSESLNGYENWMSFFNKHFIERACKKDLLRKLQTCFDEAPGIMAFVASPGWGKTFLLRDIAIELFQKGRTVIWLNPNSTIEIQATLKEPIVVGTWDIRRIDALVGMINDKAREASLPDDETAPLIVSDNCSERSEEALTLFRYLASNNRRFVLSLAFRDNEFKALSQQHPLLKRCKMFKPEGTYNSSDEIRTLIDFCTQHHVALIETPAQKEAVVQSIVQSEAETAIILALQIIFDKQHRPFTEIVKSVWQSIKNEHAKRLVLRVASLHRFGSNFYPRLYSVLNTFPSHVQFEILEAYKECCKEGVLFEEMEDGEPCVRTLHSLVAEKIAEIAKTRTEVDDELLLLCERMTSHNLRDLELVRHLLKQINDYTISLSSEERVEKLFNIAVESTSNDWVVCQQFSKYLLKRGEFEFAFAWANRALEKNPDNAALQHHKGNVLRRWGMKLKEERHDKEADEKFQEARKYFTLSRVGSMPTEYGYVTHLDMLLYLINNSNEHERTSLIAEGAQIYKEGVRVVPEDSYNLLLEDRFRIFDLQGDAVGKLCEKIEKAVEQGRSSVYGIAFLADNVYRKGDYEGAIKKLQEQRKRFDESVLLWVKEAEFHAREGNFSDAAKCLHSARTREKNAEHVMVLWSMLYWNLITSFVIEDYKEARIMAGGLVKTGVMPRQRLPRGYIWKESAKKVRPNERNLKLHARIWLGRIESIQIGGRYGRIELTNPVGDTFNLDFSPKYFSQRNLRTGDFVKFAVAIHPYGLEAVSEDTKPFFNTTDDVFVKA